MTRSPLLSTLLPLIPLAAMAWPLHRVIHQEAFQQVPEIEVAASPTRRAYLDIRSAHPFTEVTVSIGNAHWTFSPEENTKVIYFPLDDTGDLHLDLTAIWPEGTPETAVFLELTPDEMENRSHTVWGIENVTEPIDFHWDINQ